MNVRPFLSCAATIVGVTAFAPRVAHARTELVHVDSPKPVTLERRVAGAVEWERLCSSPCDVPVPTDGELRVVGAGVKSSRTFAVLDTPGSRPPITLHVRPASRDLATIGIVTTSIGALVATFAGAMYLSEAVSSSGFGSGWGSLSSVSLLACYGDRSRCSSGGGGPSSSSVDTAPIVAFAAIGAAVTVGGAATMVAVGATHVRGDHVVMVGHEAVQPREPPPRPRDGERALVFRPQPAPSITLFRVAF